MYILHTVADIHIWPRSLGAFGYSCNLERVLLGGVREQEGRLGKCAARGPEPAGEARGATCSD